MQWNYLDEFDASVASLKSAADSLSADCVLLRERVATGDDSITGTGSETIEEKSTKKTAQFLVRQRADEKVQLEILKKILSGTFR